MRGLEGAGCTDGCILVYSNMHGHSLESERKIVGLKLMMSMTYYKVIMEVKFYEMCR